VTKPRKNQVYTTNTSVLQFWRLSANGSIWCYYKWIYKVPLPQLHITHYTCPHVQDTIGHSTLPTCVPMFKILSATQHSLHVSSCSRDYRLLNTRYTCSNVQETIGYSTLTTRVLMLKRVLATQHSLYVSSCSRDYRLLNTHYTCPHVQETIGLFFECIESTLPNGSITLACSFDCIAPPTWTELIWSKPDLIGTVNSIRSKKDHKPHYTCPDVQ